MMKMRMKTAWALALVMVMAYWSAHVVDSGRDGRESEGGEARDRTAEKKKKRRLKARRREVSPKTVRWVLGVGCQRTGWACQKSRLRASEEISMGKLWSKNASSCSRQVLGILYTHASNCFAWR
jgi:hypothetical protein